MDNWFIAGFEKDADIPGGIKQIWNSTKGLASHVGQGVKTFAQGAGKGAKSLGKGIVGNLEGAIKSPGRLTGANIGNKAPVVSNIGAQLKKTEQRAMAGGRNVKFAPSNNPPAPYKTTKPSAAGQAAASQKATSAPRPSAAGQAASSQQSEIHGPPKPTMVDKATGAVKNFFKGPITGKHLAAGGAAGLAGGYMLRGSGKKQESTRPTTNDYYS